MDSGIQNVFSVTKNDRSYVFNVPDKAPFGEALDALFEIITALSDMQKAAIDTAKSTVPATQPVPSTVEGQAPATPVDATLAN